MMIRNNSYPALVLVAIGSMIAFTACGAPDDSVSEDEQVGASELELHRHHASSAAATTGGSTSGGSTSGGSTSGSGGAGGIAPGCELCAKASTCCATAGADPSYCASYSATTCSTISPASQPYYIQNCKVLINLIKSLYSPPPAICL